MAKCPACGGKMEYKYEKVYAGTTSSYSLSKGVVGGLLLGPIGTVAGIGGKQKDHYTSVKYYVCSKCGNRILDQDMPLDCLYNH